MYTIIVIIHNIYSEILCHSEMSPLSMNYLDQPFYPDNFKNLTTF